MMGLGISSLATWIRTVEASFNIANTALESQPTHRYLLAAQVLLMTPGHLKARFLNGRYIFRQD